MSGSSGLAELARAVSCQDDICRYKAHLLFCGALQKWSGTRFPGSQKSSAPGPAARAQQLADVSLFVYEAGGSTIHLPLEPSHALVAVLKKALEREGKELPGKEWLVSFVLSVQQGSPIIIAHITSQGS